MTDLIERLRAASYGSHGLKAEAANEIERLRAVIIRAKDALLDGQSTQWVHDLLVTALLGPKPLKAIREATPRDDGTVIAVGGEPGASAGKSE